MSLIRNQRGSATNQTLTAKRFVAGEPISGDSFRPIEYIQVDNGYIGETRKWVLVNSVSSFIIKAEFSQGASGTLIGRADGLQIVKDESYIKWKNSGTDLYQVAWKEGLQLYGFVRIGTQTLPYYEGEVITSASPAGEFPTMPMMLGIATDSNGDVTGNPISGTTWGFRVSEVIGDLLYSDGSENKQMIFHWYATRRSSGQAPILFETRSDSELSNLGCVTGQGRTYTAGEDVTYGMQVDDLKIAFGSPYFDLLMILADDGGIDREIGWKGSSESVRSDIDLAANPATFTAENYNHKMAFNIPSSLIEGHPTVTPPPGTWEVGQLLRGRKGRWSLWNDNVLNFKYIKPVSIGPNTGYKLMCNILKDVYGRNMVDYDENTKKQFDQLLAFDGYNNSKVIGFHAPKILFDGAVGLTFFGDIAFDTQGKSVYFRDIYYAYEKISDDANVKVILGNLPWWKLSQNGSYIDAQGVSHPINELDATAVTGDINAPGLNIYGAHVAVEMVANGGEWIPISTLHALTPDTTPLCAETSSEVKEAFQVTGVDSVLAFGGPMAIARLANDGDMITRLTMYLARNRSQTPNMIADVIDCSEIVPSTLVTTKAYKKPLDMRLIGDMDVNGNSGIVTKMVTGETTYDIYLKNYSQVNIYNYLFIKAWDGEIAPDDRQVIDPDYDGDEIYFYGLGIQFALVPTSVQSPSKSDTINLFGGTTERTYGYLNSDYLVYVECEVLVGWASMFGTTSDKVFVGERDDFSTASASVVHFVDAHTGDSYHRSGGSYVKDEEIYGSRPTNPTTEDLYRTYYTGLLEIPNRWGHDGQWHILPSWFKKGCMTAKYSGWARPFCKADAGGVYTYMVYGATRQIWDDSNNPSTTVIRSPKHSISGLNWGYIAGDDQYKLAEAVVYLNHMALTQGTQPELNPSSDGEYQPSVARYQVFKASTAPISCGPWPTEVATGNGLCYPEFSDKAENYLFYASSGHTGNKYAVVGSDGLLIGVGTYRVVEALLQIYDGDNIDKTDEGFQPFYLSVYRQEPCTPHSSQSQSYHTFDTTWRLTACFEDLLIGQTHQSYSKNNYSVYVESAAPRSGAYPSQYGQTKWCALNPECLLLTVNSPTTPVPGTKYIYKIRPYGSFIPNN